MVLLMGGHAESVSEASTFGCARERSVADLDLTHSFVNTQAAAPRVDEVGGVGGNLDVHACICPAFCLCFYHLAYDPFSGVGLLLLPRQAVVPSDCC